MTKEELKKWIVDAILNADLGEGYERSKKLKHLWGLFYLLK